MLNLSFLNQILSRLNIKLIDYSMLGQSVVFVSEGRVMGDHDIHFSTSGMPASHWSRDLMLITDWFNP